MVRIEFPPFVPRALCRVVGRHLRRQFLVLPARHHELLPVAQQHHPLVLVDRLGLGFLYAISHKRPLWEQMVLFGIYSLVVKFAEQRILGTWEFSRFFFIEGNLAYLIGWSVVDALYPIGAYFVLKIASRFVTGLVVPDLKLR